MLPLLQEQIISDRTLALHPYTHRLADGETSADCGMNGVDWPEGQTALLNYVRTWPQRGFEVRKQFVLFQNRPDPG